MGRLYTAIHLCIPSVMEYSIRVFVIFSFIVSSQSYLCSLSIEVQSNELLLGLIATFQEMQSYVKVIVVLSDLYRTNLSLLFIRYQSGLSAEQSDVGSSDFSDGQISFCNL